MDVQTSTIRRLAFLSSIVMAVSLAVACTSTLGTRPRKNEAAPDVLPPQLNFIETVWPSDAEGRIARDSELHVAEHHDFPFRNEGDTPVQIWLQARSCACSRIELGLLPCVSLGETSLASIGRAEARSLIWHPLTQEDGKGVTIPAHAAGVVRLGWRGREPGLHRLVVNLRTAPDRMTRMPIRLEVIRNFVEPVQVSSEDNLKGPPGDENWVGTLGPGDVRTIRILVWSSTRTNFDLAEQPPTDPFITWGRPESLSTAECERLSLRDGKEVRCAYRISVTVREQAVDGTRLDLGRFHRDVQLTRATGLDPTTLSLGGIVHGPVTVGSPEEGGRISMGSFQRSLGRSRQITLAAEASVPGLAVESYPPFLKVILREEPKEEAHGKVWTLTVEVPPDSLIGPLPPDSNIVLRTTDDRPRRICIPITGCAYFQ